MYFIDLNKISFLVILLEVGVICTQAQIPFLGKCPDRQAISKFDVDSYMGRWYEIEKYFAIFEIGGTCIEANYSALENGTVTVVNTQKQKTTGQLQKIKGIARPIDPNGAGKLGVRFPTVPFAGEAPYWIMDTDYKHYSIVWSCSDFSILNLQIVWYLSRERNPSREERQKVHDKIAQIGLRRDLLQKTDQTNCGSEP